MKLRHLFAITTAMLTLGALSAPAFAHDREHATDEAQILAEKHERGGDGSWAGYGDRCERAFRRLERMERVAERVDRRIERLEELLASGELSEWQAEIVEDRLLALDERLASLEERIDLLLGKIDEHCGPDEVFAQ
jgi:predicted translin family RNA/ssDNA-binding protein